MTKFDVNSPESYSNIYLNQFIAYCKDSKIKERSINNYLSPISSLFHFYSIQLPDIEKFKRDAPEWNLLEKEDFKFIMSDSTLNHSSLIKFLESTGFRLADALSRTIGDFMEATSEYHNCADVEDFIDTAPQDMIGTWQFYPHKTKRFNLKCITCNDSETSNLILQNLRKIKDEFLPKLNKKHGLNLRISKSDALFPSRKAQYKGHLSQRTVSDMFYKKNMKLRNHHISLIDEKIKKGLISFEDREKEISKIPKFHAHGCRKYFQTIISRNCGDLRICALMEGHKSPIPTDPSYIKKETEEVKEAYMLPIPDLSLENTETKVYTSQIRQEMESKMKKLENENKYLSDKLSNVDDIMERLTKLEEKN